MELPVEFISDLLSKRHQAYLICNREAAPAIDIVLGLYGIEVQDTTHGTTWRVVSPTAESA
jgi:hypothetical protein